MKKTSLLGIVCSGVLLACAAPTYAEDAISLKTSDGYEVGAQISRYVYEEPDFAPSFPRTKGNRFGLMGTVTKTLGNDWYINGDLRYSYSDVSYKGGTQGGQPLTNSGISDKLWEIRVTGGKDFAMNGYLLSPYFGLGYRNLVNELAEMGPSGYRRESQYWYLPLGITHRFQMDSESRISTSFEYDYFIRGQQQSDLSDVNPRANNPQNDQHHGYGLRASVAYERTSWSVGLFYDYWKIADSDTANITVSGIPVSQGSEPKNTTDEYGVQVKYRF
jgi:hypothetical protein